MCLFFPFFLCFLIFLIKLYVCAAVGCPTSASWSRPCLIWNSTNKKSNKCPNICCGKSQKSNTPVGVLFTLPELHLVKAPARQQLNRLETAELQAPGFESVDSRRLHVHLCRSRIRDCMKEHSHPHGKLFNNLCLQRSCSWSISSWNLEPAFIGRWRKQSATEGGENDLLQFAVRNAKCKWQTLNWLLIKKSSGSACCNHVLMWFKLCNEKCLMETWAPCISLLLCPSLWFFSS